MSQKGHKDIAIGAQRRVSPPVGKRSGRLRRWIGCWWTEHDGIDSFAGFPYKLGTPQILGRKSSTRENTETVNDKWPHFYCLMDLLGNWSFTVQLAWFWVWACRNKIDTWSPHSHWAYIPGAGERHSANKVVTYQVVLGTEMKTTVG